MYSKKNKYVYCFHILKLGPCVKIFDESTGTLLDLPDVHTLDINMYRFMMFNKGTFMIKLMFTHWRGIFYPICTDL